MTIGQDLEQLVEWCTPQTAKHDPHVKKRVRMFLISHLAGPLLGLPIPVALSLYDPNPWPHVHILAASIAAFWLFPLAARIFARHYTALALISVSNLSFAILWGSYHYGGASSPFLMWLPVLPLLAFFYLGSSRMTRLLIFAQIVLGLGAFYAAFLLENSFPAHIPIQEMIEIGILSALCAAIYVFLMASYYARAIESRSDLLREIDHHQATLRELSTAKDDAERANRAKSDFLAKMSHELRTPLNAVLGYSEILLEDAELDGRGEQIADLQKISGAGKHLLAMVNDILDISKIEAGKMELNLESVDLAKLIDEVDATGRPLAAKNTNAFVVDRPDDLGCIQADATKMRQAIFNLLANAAKFTHNGKITLSAERVRGDGGDWITIAVSDTGVGLSQEQQALLFSNFSQASPSIAAKFGGTGLGLSLSQNLCRLMGGRITVESELGQGATFTIHLPAVDAERVDNAEDGPLQIAMSDIEEYKAAPGGSLLHPSGDRSQEKILVVDDDHAVLDLVDRLLRKEGCSAISTDAPQTILQIARTVKPAAIFVDILMPVMNGWDVLEALKADPVTTDIPVIMLSTLEEGKRALESGAAGFLAKPLEGRKLQAVLKIIRERQLQGSSEQPQSRVVAG